MYQDIDIIVSTTLPTLDVLMNYKNGGDALLLYFRYVRQARLQKTNQTYSKDEFMYKGMGWSRNKFYNVKKVLTENNLIETVIKNGPDGKIEGSYVKVNFIIQEPTSTVVLKNNTTEKPEDGKRETNAGSNKKENALNNKYKYKDKKYLKEEAIDLVYKSYQERLPRDKKKFTKAGDSKLQIKQIFNAKFTLEQLMTAQDNYFRTQSPSYIMACQYFYSNKEAGKTYRPFLDYLEKKEEVKERSVNFDDLF